MVFLGPGGLTAALPQGGPMQDDYPANLNTYMDGLLRKEWEVKNEEGSDSSKVSKAVS